MTNRKIMTMDIKDLSKKEAEQYIKDIMASYRNRGRIDVDAVVYEYDDASPPKKVPMKYDEAEYIKEILGYIESTYQQHYVGEDGIQSLDITISTGHGMGFCIGSAQKYVNRYGKKAGYNRKDLMKAIHFLILMLHVHDSHVDTKEPHSE
jgi:hypothetical protein